MLKVVVVAATGGIGRQLLKQALEAGHDVTAVVRDPTRLGDVPVRVVRCDLARAAPGELDEAMAGAGAVLSALGARSGAEAGVASRGTHAIVQAMRATGVRRVIAVSAASVGTVPSPGRPAPPRYNPGDGPVTRYVFAPVAKKLFRPHYLDLAIMEDVLRDSGLDWTVSRPPRLLDHALRPAYRTARDVNVRGGMFISRVDVARHMLSLIDDAGSVHHTISVAY
ncbi:SDR family oxidoreductase [Winogradskya consettensis]|uniref:NADH-flavin reductase n=1 Tax=Winogradskya consettensis TaxID=113560 RepID=A0A919SEK9_9ACTN|nr:NAD(P)H-binding protein [Actinoplanes consettensis]GIM69638.1 NADH-flavin reductase [Actinoplanes consettensis]